jgi:hypothetical protein
MGFGSKMGTFGLKIFNGIVVPKGIEWKKEHGGQPKELWHDFRKDYYDDLDKRIIKELGKVYEPFTLTKEEKRVFRIQNRTITKESYLAWCEKQKTMQEEEIEIKK